MEDNKYQIICELMDELKKEMQMGHGDLEERLGRKKPDVEVVKVEGELPMGEEKEEVEMPEGDEIGIEEMSPGAKLKSRLAKLRG